MQARQTVIWVGAVFVAIVGLIGFTFVTNDAETQRFQEQSQFEYEAVHTPIPDDVQQARRAPVPAGKPVITPAAAKELVNAVVPVRATAIIAGDTQTLLEIDSQSAFHFDTGFCGCPDNFAWDAAEGGTNGAYASAVFVPQKTTFPAQFLAEVVLTSSNGRHYREFMVFHRNYDQAPWTVLHTNVTEIELPKLSMPRNWVGEDGYEISRPTPRMSATELMTKLAAQWQHQKNEGTGDPLLPFRADEGERFTLYPQDGVGPNGLAGHYEYEARPNDMTYEYSWGTDATLVCGVIHGHVSYTAAPGGRGPYQDADRSNWGSSLAPGSYSQLDQERLFQPCIVLPNDASRRATVFDGDQARGKVFGTR